MCYNYTIMTVESSNTEADIVVQIEAAGRVKGVLTSKENSELLEQLVKLRTDMHEVMKLLYLKRDLTGCLVVRNNSYIQAVILPVAIDIEIGGNKVPRYVVTTEDGFKLTDHLLNSDREGKDRRRLFGSKFRHTPTGIILSGLQQLIPDQGPVILGHYVHRGFEGLDSIYETDSLIISQRDVREVKGVSLINIKDPDTPTYALEVAIEAKTTGVTENTIAVASVRDRLKETSN